MPKPVIILVPGCWHVPAHFDYVQRELETAGYECLGVDLPGNNRTDATISDDIAAIRGHIVAQLDRDQDVVLVTHSYSSIPGTSALTKLSADGRRSEGKATCVKQVVIISGFLLPPATTMLAVMGGQLAPQYLHQGDSTLPFNGPGATHVLYNDLEPVEAEKAIWQLKAQSYAINTSPIPDQVASLQGIGLSYLACGNDNAVPPATQAAVVAGFQNAGIKVYAEVAATGHSPFLKAPKETALFIRRAAGEDRTSGWPILDPEVFGRD